MGNNQKITPETIGSVPRCRACQSERVVKDAAACFNRESGLWELERVLDQARCQQCEAKAELEWHSADAIKNNCVRELNDRFRTSGRGNGSVLVTSGVQERGGTFVVAAVKAVRTFSDFSPDVESRWCALPHC